MNPLGIIDDIKSNKIRHVVWNKVLNFVPLAGNNIINLGNRNIVSSSFSCSVSNILNPKDGKMSILGHCLGNSQIGKLTQITVTYAYNVFTDICDGYHPTDGYQSSNSCVHDGYTNNTNDEYNSIVGTNQCTIWDKNLIVQTDMFDTCADYVKYQKLYVSNGFLTSKNPLCGCKSVGYVLKGPTYDNPVLEFLFDLKENIEIGDF